MKNNTFQTHPPAGFTLVELLVSLVIFVLILVAVSGAFYTGIKVWRKGCEGRDLQKVRLFFLKIEKELKGSFFFSKIPFKGTDREIVFPLSISSGDREGIYIVTYSVQKDVTTGLMRLIREERPFSETGKIYKTKPRILLKGMESIEFEYAYKSEGPSPKIVWQSGWNGMEQNRFPLGVKIALKMKQERHIYHKIIFLHNRSIDVR